MPRPFRCAVHGADVVTRWRRNGRSPNGAAKRTRSCVLCHPPRGASLEGRTTCPRCGSDDITVVRGGRPGQAPYRGCRRCRRWRNLRYRLAVGAVVHDDYDPGLKIAEAMDNPRTAGYGSPGVGRRPAPTGGTSGDRRHEDRVPHRLAL